MFGFKKSGNAGATTTKVKVDKLPRPREIPGLVQNHLVGEKKMNPDIAQVLKAVVRKRQNGQEGFNIRIFDESDAIANKIEIKNYTSLDEHPNLVLYDGWFDESSKKLELVEKNKISQDTTIFSQEEVQQKIEELSEPGSTVFFYMARGPSNGGPLGRGASVVELSPQIQGKKQKKYTLYCVDVVNMRPVNKGDKLFDSDKVKDIAKWIKEAHHKRMY